MVHSNPADQQSGKHIVSLVVTKNEDPSSLGRDGNMVNGWHTRLAAICHRIFLEDGSSLFVPGNPDSEGSVVIWSDEYNQPADYSKVTAQKRKRFFRDFRGVFH